MNDITDKQQSSDASESSSLPAEQAPSASSAPKPSRLPLVLFLLVLIGLVAVVVIGQWQLKRIDQVLAQMDSAISQSGGKTAGLQAQIANLSEGLKAQHDAVQVQKQDFQKQQQLLAAERENLLQTERQIKAQLASVHQRIGRSSSQWMVAEAEYLVRVANYRLRLERDVSTAVSALQGADERLKATQDPAWTGVREALAWEIGELRAMEKLDLIGMAASLANMANQVQKLPLIGSRPDKPTGPEDILSMDAMQAVLAEGWKGIRSMVVVRNNNEPVTAMLPPEQHYFVHQNLRLQLETARFALLRYDAALFRSSLATARGWLEEFVVPGDGDAQVIREEIERLEQINIRPELPDISGSLRLLTDQMAEI